jgi:hypothetical protein
MKKKITLVGVIIVCTLFLGMTTHAGINTPVLENTKEKQKEITAVSMNFIPPKIIENQGYALIESDMAHLMSEGLPMIPYKAEVLTFPFKTKIERVDIQTSAIKTMYLDKKIAPAPGPVTLNEENVKMMRRESQVYESNEPFPPEWVEWDIGVGIENGEHVVFLSIHAYPARYVPATNVLQYIGEISIVVEYEKPQKLTTQNDVHNLLIISPSAFTEKLQPFVAHKETFGISTKLVSLEEIYDGSYFMVAGRDDAEQVKYFIKNAIEEWGTQYVLLTGGRHGGYPNGNWWCPVRYTHLDANDGDRSFLSDLYFSDIYKYQDGEVVFEDWDPNGNDLFGEYSIQAREEIDMYPDVYIGRWPCRTAFEVDVIVEKTITYETTAYGQGWTKRYVGIGADTFPGDQWYDGEATVTNVTEYLAPLGYEFNNLLYSENPFTGKDIIEAISEGCGFLQFEGHGTPTSWASHRPNGEEDEWDVYINALQFPLLKNKDMYPICVVGGCSNSKFDITILDILDFEHLQANIEHGSIGLECFDWWMTRKVDGGSVATIGCTSYGYGTRGDSNHDGIFDGIQIRGGFIDIEFFRTYAQEDKNILGEAHGQALTNFQIKFPFLDGHDDTIEGKTLREWILFGDPSLKIGGYP